MVVTLVEIETPQAPEQPEITGLVADCVTTTSSTAIFSWYEAAETSELVSQAFTATLYKDAACTVVDQSFDFPADCGAWQNKTPKYVFGGLQPSTDYWFKVYDTTADLESEPIKCTTDPFTHVLMPETITSTGVILSEDFGEIRWEFDHFTSAVGFKPLDSSDFANTEVNTGTNNDSNKIYGGYHANAGGEMSFKGQGTAISNSRLNGWLSDTDAYIHPGYIKLGTSSKRGWMLTPEFTVPEGKKAIVKVTVTAARHNTSQAEDWGVIVLSPELAVADPAAHTAAFEWPDTEDATLYQEMTFSNTGEWATKSVEGLVVRAKDRIAFGGEYKGGGKTGRAYISDMIIEVIEIVNE